MQLYQIQQEYLQLMEELEENEGILEDNQEEQLAIVKENWENKANQFIKIIKSLDNDTNNAQLEIERIQKYINTKEKIKERFKNQLLEGLRVFGQKDKDKEIYRYSTETFKISTRKSESVEIHEDEIDIKWKTFLIDKLSIEEFTTISDTLGRSFEQKVSILKTPIKEAIEKGEEVVGASVVTNFGITIK